MRHIVFFSGGIGSWAAAKRVAAEHGVSDVTLLFTDTLIEDADCYRFLREAAVDLECELEWLREGRDPWTVFHDVRFIGNTRANICSRVLKQEPARKWVEENCDPADTTLYIGISWDEEHRLAGVRRGWEGWHVEAPLCDEPFLMKDQILELCIEAGIDPPRMYEQGFPHANCGGFCVKAGQGHFAHLLKIRPELYAHHEGKEQEFREFIGKDVAILRDRRGGTTKPMTMTALRERIQGGKSLDLFEWGGCGCFSEE